MDDIKCVSEAQIDEVLRMLPYVSREDIEKDLTITRSVEHTINRILDGQLTQESIVTRQKCMEERRGLTRDESSPPLTASCITAPSSFACDLPSPPKKRKFVFRRIDKVTIQKKNDFYSDGSDVELDAVDTGHDVKVDHNAPGLPSGVVDLNNLSDDCEQNDMANPEKHDGCDAMGGHKDDVYQSERSDQIVHCISSDDDADAESMTDHRGVNSHHSDDHSETNSHVTGCHLSHASSSHCYSPSPLTSDCDDLPELNIDSGSCLTRVDSQTSTSSTIRSQSQASVFSTDSAPTTSRRELDSQTSELSTAGGGNKLTNMSRNATKMQKDERGNVRERKKDEQDIRRRAKEEERALKQQRREELQRAKAFEKSKKQAQQAAIRQVKPGECLKFMTVVIDPAVLKTPGGSTVLDTLQKAEVKYEIVAQPLPNIVTFWREVTKVTETEPQQLHSHTQDVVESQILLALPLSHFIELVHATQTVRRGMASDDTDTLTTYVQRARDLLEGRHITLLIQRLEGYFRDQKTREDRAFRGLVLGNQGGQRSRGQKEVLPDVTRLDVEEVSDLVRQVLLDLQMRCQCNVKIMETDAELGKMILHYTRAIAETPFKKDRLKTCFSFHVDKKGCVKVDKEGHGLATVWRQQLQQFKNVSADMANAIVAEYPSPWLLHQAYTRCLTEKCAEELLQDILVRRGAGVLSTSRRIGKELSRRIHQLLTATDPNLVIS